MKITDLIFTFLFPKYCILCSRPGEYICAPCLSTKFINYHETYCHICHGLLRHEPKGNTLHFVHRPCRKRTSLDGLFAVWEYNEAVGKIISAIKYHFQHQVVSCLKPILRFKYSSLPIAVDLIIPVPLFWQRKAWRGFNQAELLANCLGWNQLHPLIRNRKTKPQAKMNRNKRLSNLTGSFTLKPRTNVIDKSILLVDDVTTTGSTLEAAARCLKDHGAKSVYGFVLALEK